MEFNDSFIVEEVRQMEQKRAKKIKKWIEKSAGYGKRHRKLAVSAAAVLALCLVAAAAAGIVLAADDGSGPVADQADANALAKTLVNEGITFEDAVILKGGGKFQYATFTGLPGDYYDFGDGIILSSGNAVQAFGSYPSGVVGTTSSTYKNAPDIAGKAYFRLYETYDSYCKKAGVSSSSLNDAAVFAIKITPSTSDLSFRYFFASNEYNQPPLLQRYLRTMGGAGFQWDEREMEQYCENSGGQDAEGYNE